MRYQTVAKVFALAYGVKMARELAQQTYQDKSGITAVHPKAIHEAAIFASLTVIANHADLLQENESFWWKVFCLLVVWERKGLPKWVK